MRETGKIFVFWGLLRFLMGSFHLMTYMYSNSPARLNNAGKVNDIASVIANIVSFVGINMVTADSTQYGSLEILTVFLLILFSSLHIRGLLIATKNVVKVGFALSSRHMNLICLSLTYLCGTYLSACSLLLLRGQIPQHLHTKVGLYRLIPLVTNNLEGNTYYNEHNTLSSSYFYSLFDCFFAITFFLSFIYLFYDYRKKQKLIGYCSSLKSDSDIV